MREDKRCESCEWWDIGGELTKKDGRFVRDCLRWPGDPWLQTEAQGRCWQHIGRTRETEDLGQIRELVNDLTTSLIHARLRLALARQLLDEAYGIPAMPEKWQEQADAWLNVKD